MSERQKWQRQPQECDGDYHFNGQIYATRGILNRLPREEIMQIVNDVQKAVEEQLGLDYLQVFKEKETGQKIYFIDQLTKQQVDSGNYPLEENYSTLMFPEEY